MRCHLALLLTLTLVITSAQAEEVKYFRLKGPVSSHINGLNPDGYLTWTNLLTNGVFNVETSSSPGPSNWVTFVQIPTTEPTNIHWLYNPHPPAGMVLVPGGLSTMGDTLGDTGGIGAPLHTNIISAFYMDKYEVTKALWDEVYSWAITHGYIFQFGAQGKAATHPAQNMTWYDAALWCNARSEKEGLAPAYFTSATLTAVYRSGLTNVQNTWVKWTNGYRLPTEAEWETAARGGPVGRRFPWTDTNIITHSRANYTSSASFAYDTSATRGVHPTFNVNPAPFTSPVGYFAPNGYGIYDLAGNVWEWCWDWDHQPYPAGATDPRGPTVGTDRVQRGGSWLTTAPEARVANHAYFTPTGRANNIGFRTVLPAP